jgi:hypothetical protein
MLGWYGGGEWGHAAAPIPIEPGTIQVRLIFPSDAAITKYEFSFDFAQSLMDFELVPVFAAAELLNYVPPIAAHMTTHVYLSGGGLGVIIYALYARQAGDFNIPITGLASYLELRDGTNTIISASFTESPPGFYYASFSPALPTSGNPYTVRVVGAPASVFDYTTAVAQFNV